MNDTAVTATLKVTVAWVGVVVGGLTLSNIALVLTIVFTSLQICKLVRQELRDRRAARAASAAFAETIRNPDTTPEGKRP